MLGKSNIPMVSDFGLARDIYESGMYETTSGVSSMFDEGFFSPKIALTFCERAMNDDSPLQIMTIILRLDLLFCVISPQLTNACGGFRCLDFYSMFNNVKTTIQNNKNAEMRKIKICKHKYNTKVRYVQSPR